MSPRALALAFLDAFAAGDVDALGGLLHEALDVRGPFFAGDTAAAYLGALRADPPEPAVIDVLALFETPSEVCVVYTYRKRAATAEMAQWFVFEAGQIRKIRLFFDPTVFR